MDEWLLVVWYERRKREKKATDGTDTCREIERVGKTHTHIHIYTHTNTIEKA